MVFSSTIFLFFYLPIFFILYYLVPKKWKNYILLIFSLFFYAYGEPRYIVLLIFTSFVDYMNGRLLLKNQNVKTRKLYLFFAITINLSLLGFFKYGNFFIKIINDISPFSISLFPVSLPIGISFYTFQSMSYSIDVYRDSSLCEKSFLKYLMYVSLFPQLVAGPIVRYSQIHKELDCRQLKKEEYLDGFLRFLRGLFKKVLIANNIGLLYESILASNLQEVSVVVLWLGIISYAIQIYYDFSGYSDMAIGLGLMLGFHFEENFNFPYLSKSITEFWRRWHISLGTWFKDYVLYPFLKSNAIQKLQFFLKKKWNKKLVKYIITSLGTTLVFFLTGLWHGANYNYILWGLYYGLFLILEEIFLKKYLANTKIWNHFYVLLVVLIGYVIFSIEDFSILVMYLKGMFGFLNNSFYHPEFLFYLQNYFIFLFFGIIFCFPIRQKLKKLDASRGYQIIRIFIYVILFVVSVMYIVCDTYNPFLYFRF